MKVEAWLVIRGVKSSYGAVYPHGSPYAGQVKVDRARAVKITANKPSLNEEEIAMKVEIDVDESWFLDGTATIKATVPAQPQSTTAIQAQVDTPVRGRAKSAAASVIKP